MTNFFNDEKAYEQHILRKLRRIDHHAGVRIVFFLALFAIATVTAIGTFVSLAAGTLSLLEIQSIFDHLLIPVHLSWWAWFLVAAFLAVVSKMTASYQNILLNRWYGW